MHVFGKSSGLTGCVAASMVFSKPKPFYLFNDWLRLASVCAGLVVQASESLILSRLDCASVSRVVHILMD